MKNSTISPSGTLLPIERNFTIGRQIPWKSYLKQTDKTPGHKKIFPLCLAAEICSRIKTFLAPQTPLPIPRIEKLCCCNASLQLVRGGFPCPSGFKLCGSTILTREPPSLSFSRYYAQLQELLQYSLLSRFLHIQLEPYIVKRSKKGDLRTQYQTTNINNWLNKSKYILIYFMYIVKISKILTKIGTAGIK